MEGRLGAGWGLGARRTGAPPEGPGGAGQRAVAGYVAVHSVAAQRSLSHDGLALNTRDDLLYCSQPLPPGSPASRALLCSCTRDSGRGALWASYVLSRMYCETQVTHLAISSPFVTLTNFVRSDHFLVEYLSFPLQDELHD